MDRGKFYDVVRARLYNTFGLGQESVDGFEAILNANEKTYKLPKTQLAYLLATAYHETAHTIKPLKEWGRGKKKAYGKTVRGNVYYGRGLVQLTWHENYVKMGKILGVDLESNPDLAIDLSVSVDIIFVGMIRGIFTGKKLSDYFKDFPPTAEPILARAIVNGRDRAALIADYYDHFLDALVAAEADVTGSTIIAEITEALKQVQAVLSDVSTKISNLIAR